jgi:RNA polymerase sigma-70 factor (ECF subfamily)
MRRDGETAMSRDIRHSPGKVALRLVSSRRAPATIGDAVDAALMARIAAGDRRAMQVLYTRHHVRIRRFILRLAGNAAVADELVHEVFLDVWRKAGRFAGRSRVSTWLITIARQKAIATSRSRPNAPLDGGVAESLEDPADNAEVIADKTKGDSILRLCLVELLRARGIPALPAV